MTAPAGARAPGGSGPTTVAWVSLAALIVVLVALLGAGWRPVVLGSDSMAPGAPAGSLLVARPVAAGDVRVGDVVTLERDGGARVTHRVVALEELDGTRWARLRGDANDAPDPGRVALVDGTLRTVAVVPGIGRIVAGGNPLLLAGLALVLLGGAGLTVLGPRRVRDAPVRGPLTEGSRAPAAQEDPRVHALAATVEALAEDGLAPALVAALTRVRAAPLLGLGPFEEAPEAASLDDAGRFVAMALADVDLDALALLPPTAVRVVAALDVIDGWWHRVTQALPVSVTDTVDAASGTSAR